MSNRGRSIASLRNLPQFRGLSDDEIRDKLQDKSFSARIKERIDKLAEEYDLTDMKYHDRILLEQFMALTIRLEDEQLAEEQAKADGEIVQPSDAARKEQQLSIMRNDLLKIQNDLGISRLKRKDTVEDSPLILFQDIRARAKRFLESRLSYVKCPECGLVLCKVNFLYPAADNKITLTCGRCSAKVEFNSSEVLDMERKNPYK
jgi:hypothetical protein